MVEPEKLYQLCSFAWKSIIFVVVIVAPSQLPSLSSSSLLPLTMDGFWQIWRQLVVFLFFFFLNWPIQITYCIWKLVVFYVTIVVMIFFFFLLLSSFLKKKMNSYWQLCLPIPNSKTLLPFSVRYHCRLCQNVHIFYYKNKIFYFQKKKIETKSKA